ncbi:MAG: nuclear transport factor 2 family protein [Gemmatimonadetes bacterium]|nr:nuclear transport factor 2 family protein [Gemmatimonadota bacterium]
MSVLRDASRSHHDRARRGRACVGMVVLIAAACRAGDAGPLSTAHRTALHDSVRSFVESIPGALAEGGPAAWLRFFEESGAFFMASDGQVAFPGPDSARAFLSGFAPSVTSMTLEWEGLRIEPVQPGIAVVASGYREMMTFADGRRSAFGGYVSGLARKQGDGWRLQHLHWSSPVPAR